MGKIARQLQAAVIPLFLLMAWCVPASASAPLSVALVAAPNPATLGQSVTLTATVTPSSATGKVAFYNGANMLGVGVLSGGVATLTTNLLPAGTGSLKAYYLGGPATSNTVPITVSSLPQSGFQSGVSYSSGLSTPTAVGLGDFNGDGKIDMAVVNSASGTVSIFFGNGNGTFQTPPTNYAAGGDNAGGNSIAVADFNGDGVLDLAISNYNTNNITILLGNSNGTFTPGTTVTTEAAPRGGPFCVSADFDGDGNADLAYANQNSGTVVVRLGNGDGTFGVEHTFTVGSGPSALAVGDFNNDSKPDLVVTNYNDNTVNVLQNAGSGSFTVLTAVSTGFNSNPTAVAVADLDGDGNADVVVADQGNGNLTVLLGKGTGLFNAAATYLQPAHVLPDWVAVGDVDGDGKLDLVVANGSSAGIYVFLGLGNGAFSSIGTHYANGVNPGVFAIADLNGDGRSDLIIPDASIVDVLLGSPLYPDLTVASAHTGSFTQAQTNATYTITATNSSTVARTTAPVTVVDKPPTGLVVTNIAGSGWSCTPSTLTCTRSDAVGVNTSYPAITVTATVDNNAPTGTFNNVATVSGGGESNTSNDTSSDSTTIAAASLLYSSSLAAAPAATANLPVTLSLASGTVTALNLTVTITPVSGAPALTTPPAFTKDAAQPMPTAIPASSSITLDYQSVNLSGTVHLGDVAVVIPSTATQGQSYTISVTVNSSSPTVAVPGLSATLNAYPSYLIGDVYPATSTFAGTFGDGSIDTRDLLTLLRAVTLAVPQPPACSDLFDAMDVFPVAGGDQALDTRDLLQLLRRATNADPTRPTRAPRGASCTAASPLLRLPAANPAASLQLVTTDGLTAIYLRANKNLALSGLALSVRGDDDVLGFAAKPSNGPSVVDDGLPGTLSLAWLRGVDIASGDSLLLGYVQSATPGTLHFAGVSANDKTSGRAVAISFTSGSRREQ